MAVQPQLSRKKSTYLEVTPPPKRASTTAAYRGPKDVCDAEDAREGNAGWSGKPERARPTETGDAREKGIKKSSSSRSRVVLVAGRRRQQAEHRPSVAKRKFGRHWMHRSSAQPGSRRCCCCRGCAVATARTSLASPSSSARPGPWRIKKKRRRCEVAVKTPEEVAVRLVSLQPKSCRQRSQAGSSRKYLQAVGDGVEGERL